jgi:acyl carrier protein
MPDAILELFRTALQLEDAFELQDHMGFADVPGWDSVGHMNLVSELESRFDVSLDLDEIVTLETVAAVRKIATQNRAS